MWVRIVREGELARREVESLRGREARSEKVKGRRYLVALGAAEERRSRGGERER